MAKQELEIEISGAAGSGKTKLIAIIQAALKKEGYSVIELKPFGNHGDRLMIYDEFHTMQVYTTTINPEEVTNE